MNLETRIKLPHSTKVLHFSGEIQNGHRTYYNLCFENLKFEVHHSNVKVSGQVVLQKQCQILTRDIAWLPDAWQYSEEWGISAFVPDILDQSIYIAEDGLMSAGLHDGFLLRAGRLSSLLRQAELELSAICAGIAVGLSLAPLSLVKAA